MSHTGFQIYIDPVRIIAIKLLEYGWFAKTFKALTGLCLIIFIPVELNHEWSQHALTHPTQKCFCNRQRLSHSIVNHMIMTGGMYNSSPFSVHIPNDSVCADNKLWPGVPLVIGDVVMCLKPNPLLPFGEKSVVAGLSFTILHYCGDAAKQGEWCSSQK